jgi:hypothetical protein
MAYRLHSTLDPEGALYGSQTEAKQAMEQMIQHLEARGFRRLSYSIHPARDGALMQHADGNTVNLFIRAGAGEGARDWSCFTLTSAQVAARGGIDVLNKFERAFISARGPRDMAMFSVQHPGDAYETYYMSPATQFHAEFLLRLFCALPSDPPPDEATLVVGQNGVPRSELN